MIERTHVRYSSHVPDSKVCNKCGHAKPLTEFHRQPNSPDGRKYACKACAATYGKAHYEANREKTATRHKEWYEANRTQVAAGRRAWHLERKRIVIERYGGKCACCGEANLAFLSIDHVNNDGAQHRRNIGHGKTSTRIYAWAMKNDYPDSLQVLCMNCNCGKQWNGGVCPHEEQR